MLFLIKTLRGFDKWNEKWLNFDLSFIEEIFSILF